MSAPRDLDLPAPEGLLLIGVLSEVSVNQQKIVA
jgi:hypothetical protein